MIVIGLGSGRSGTASLSKLLNSQTDAICFHEMNPSCVRFEGTPRPIINTIQEFQKIIEGEDPAMLTVDLSRGVAANAYEKLKTMKKVRLIGDIAFYYLTYVEKIIEINDNVRFICLKRDKDLTVASWIRKSSLGHWPSKKIAERLTSLITRSPYQESKNFWMEHDGTRYRPDPVWDKCFPKFPGPSKKEAIAQYWDYYYHQADILAGNYPNMFRIVETETLNDRSVQVDLLDFCGVPKSLHVHVDAHIHKSSG